MLLLAFRELGIFYVAYVPEPRAGVAGDLGQCEEHDVVGGAAGDGRVLRPVVHQVMDRLGAGGAHDGLADGAVGVVRRADQLDAFIAGELVGIAGPAVQVREQEVRLGRIRLAWMDREQQKQQKFRIACITIELEQD